MKPHLIILLSMLCALATAPVLGQTTYTWIGKNSSSDGTNLTTAANYTTNEPGDIPAVTLPGSYYAVRDILQWDNQSPPAGGAVHCTYNNGLPNTGLGTLGLDLVITANQAGNVQIAPVGGITGLIGLHNITINSTVASFSLGDGTGNANTLNIVTRPGVTGTVHDFLNDSANPAYIYPNVWWQSGGGVVYTLDIDGTGNWVITNSLATANGPNILIEKSGTGTMFWNGPSTANAAPNAGISSPISINAGTMVLQWDNFFVMNDDFVNEGYLQFNAPGQALTLNGVISGVGTNEVVAGTLTLAGNNNYGSTTYIASTGTLQIGAGGASGTPGQGNIDDDGTLVYNRSDSVTLTNSIYEDNGNAGSVVQDSSGTLTLTGNNSYTGATVVSNGTLVADGAVEGDLDVNGGAVQTGAAGSVNALTVGGNMNILAGTVVAALNEGLSPSNSLFMVTSNITYTGGALKLVNFGPALTAGDTFTVFSHAVTGGTGMKILSPGFTVANTLASNGSVTVATIASSPAEITVSESNGQVALAWPPIWTGLHLQVLMEPVGGGINATNWVTIAGSDGSDSYAASLSLTNNVFYRLAP